MEQIDKSKSQDGEMKKIAFGSDHGGYELCKKLAD